MRAMIKIAIYLISTLSFPTPFKEFLKHIVGDFRLIFRDQVPCVVDDSETEVIILLVGSYRFFGRNLPDWFLGLLPLVKFIPFKLIYDIGNSGRIADEIELPVVDQDVNFSRTDEEIETRLIGYGIVVNEIISYGTVAVLELGDVVWDPVSSAEGHVLEEFDVALQCWVRPVVVLKIVDRNPTVGLHVPTDLWVREIGDIVRHFWSPVQVSLVVETHGQILLPENLEVIGLTHNSDSEKSASIGLGLNKGVVPSISYSNSFGYLKKISLFFFACIIFFFFIVFDLYLLYCIGSIYLGFT